MDFKLAVVEFTDDSYGTDNIDAVLVLGIKMSDVIEFMGKEEILANTDRNELNQILESDADEWEDSVPARIPAPSRAGSIQQYFDSIGLGVAQPSAPPADPSPAPPNQGTYLDGVTAITLRELIKDSDTPYEDLFAPLLAKCSMGSGIKAFTDERIEQDLLFGVSAADLLINYPDSFVNEVVLETVDKLRTLFQVMLPLTDVMLYQGAFRIEGG